jgi:hypothetical protein
MGLSTGDASRAQSWMSLSCTKEFAFSLFIQ